MIFNGFDLIGYTVRVAKVCYFINHHAGSVKKTESPLFFFSLVSFLGQKRVDYNLSYHQDLSLEEIHYR